MKIITLPYSEFESACLGLAQKAVGDGFHPDIVVGIASGGDFVAECICRSITPHPRRFSVSLHRPSSKTKKGILASVLKHLPRPVCDLLRIAESRLLSFTDRFRSPSLPQTAVPSALADAVTSGLSRIMIVDDAVDSGHTLLAVAKMLRDIFPEANIHTAALTVTRRNPLITPDYTLFPTRTIVRFPWAPDA